MWVQVILLVLGADYLEKVRILYSILLVHSKISMISGNNYLLGKNGFMRMLSPLPELKIFLRRWGVHLQAPMCLHSEVFQR